MGTSTTKRISGNEGGKEKQQQAQKDDGAEEPAEAAHTQSLYTLIFRGQPQDLFSTRITDLCIVPDGNGTNGTFRLEGQHGNYQVAETWSLQPPWQRQDFLRQIHVATVSTATSSDMTLRNVIMTTLPQNTDEDGGPFHWINEVFDALIRDGLMTSAEADAALDATLNIIHQAPWQ